MLTVAVITMFSLLLSSASIRASTVSGVVDSSRSSMARVEKLLVIAVVVVLVVVAEVVVSEVGAVVMVGSSAQVGRRTVE